MTTWQQPIFQIIWGGLLLIAGVGVFFRIPQVMPGISQMDAFSSVMTFIRFSFYLIGCLLVCGGISKIRKNYKLLTDRNQQPPQS
jgi:hypothetical protein